MAEMILFFFFPGNKAVEWYVKVCTMFLLPEQGAMPIQG